MFDEDDLIIIKKDKTYKFSDYFNDYGELRVIQFDPPSINQHVEVQQIGNASVSVNKYYGPRTIPFSFDFLAHDKFDYELMCQLIQEIFVGNFYIISGRFPNIRWPVRVDGSFNIKRFSNSDIASDEIQPVLICDSGFGESVATSLTPFKFENNSWSIGMNIVTDEVANYVFENQKSFKIYNASRIPLLAEDMRMVIKFNGDAPNGLTIANKSTNQAYIYNKPLTKQNTLLIKGIQTTVDGKLAFINTNQVFLDFERFWNDIEISGASNFTISFETRFYY